MVKLRDAWRSASSVLAATAAALCLWGLWSDATGVMEGVGEWVRFQLKRQQVSPSSPWQQTLDEMMADSDAWSQQQGLALFLLIDRFVPDWQSRFLSPNFPSPFAVLREALTTPKPANKEGGAPAPKARVKGLTAAACSTWKT